MDSSILQAGNYSSHLPLIPFPLWRLHRQSAGFLCAPRFPLNQNNYGIISLLSTFTSLCGLTLSPFLTPYIFPSFSSLQYMAQSLMAGGSRGSLFSVCLLVYVCLQDVYGVDWNRMDWLCAVSVYSRFQKAASYGALYFVFVCVCVCVYCI